MPSGSIIVITFDGVNVTDRVLPGSFRFDSQLNAVPGTWEFTVKDADHTSLFVTGKEVSCDVDTVRLVGGYCLQVTRTYPFPAMDTITNPPEDTTRYWKIRGVDYNRLFDTRVLRNPANYTGRIPQFSKTTLAQTLVRQMWADYIDTPAGFDTDTYIDDIGIVYSPLDTDERQLYWKDQGTKARDQMFDFAQFAGGLWYFDADKNLHLHAIEDTVMRWGFSDQPNKLGITASPQSFQGSTIGPREIDATEAGDKMVNDALIWGGSPFGSNSGIAFSRRQNTTSQDDHGRWQYAETHFGEQGFFHNQDVQVRAEVIVDGSPGAVGADQARGLRYPQWEFRFVWFAHQVPKISGVPDHLRAGYLSHIELATFGPPGEPLIQLLPCRTMSMSIPALDPDGHGYVRFEGLFGLNPDDPFFLWKFLMAQPAAPAPAPVIVDDSVAPVDPVDPSPPPGSLGQFALTPAPNGSATVFTAPYAYVAASTRVYLYRPGVPGGVLLRRGIDYTESSPGDGQITMGSILPSGDTLRIDEVILTVAPTPGTPSGTITVTANNTVIDGKTFSATESNGPLGSRSIFVEGHASAGSPINNIIIRNCLFQKGTIGIWLQHFTNVTIEDNTFEDLDYAGIMLWSCIGGVIRRNHIFRIGAHRTDFSDGAFLNNAYGVILNRNESSSLTTDPRSENFLIDNNDVHDVPIWMAYNTHGGKDLTFSNNYAEGCPRGVFCAGSPTGAGVTECINIQVINNRLDRCVTKPGGSSDRTGITAIGWNGTKITGNQISNSFSNDINQSSLTGVAISNNPRF